jgi:hypothetical protein
LRQLFRRGRISLAIGLAFLASSIAIGDALASYFQGTGWGEILRESLLIGGWVAMWRPLEVFLYDWWPIREKARLFDRLSAMPVKIAYMSDVASDAWRSDWPAAPTGDRSSTARTPQHSPATMQSDGVKLMTPHEPKRHQHTPAEERTIREAALDDTIEASFPASDPPSSNPNPDDDDAVEPATHGRDD